jgi:CRP-like cAMP-binding protein
MVSRRLVSVDPGAAKIITTIGKKTRKPAGREGIPLQAVVTPGQASKATKVGAADEASAVFHPGLLLTQLSTGRSSREYQADESVYLQGDMADAVFYIESGKVKLTVVSTSGKEAIVSVLPEGNFFGEGCLAGQLLRMATASTTQRSTITRVAKQAMVELLHEQPEFAERFLAHLLSRNIRMEADLVDHLFNSSEKRLARLLLLMANFGQESKPIPLIARMSQESLAEMIGTTRSRVSFFMNRFRELGFIEYGDGGLHVHSSLVSVVLHD